MSDDVGGWFASDAHRRVMANLPNPDEEPLNTVDLLAKRIAKDDYLDISEADLSRVLDDLEQDGYAKPLKNGWKNTPEGFELLTGPNKEPD